MPKRFDRCAACQGSGTARDKHFGKRRYSLPGQDKVRVPLSKSDVHTSREVVSIRFVLLEGTTQSGLGLKKPQNACSCILAHPAGLGLLYAHKDDFRFLTRRRPGPWRLSGRRRPFLSFLNQIFPEKPFLKFRINTDMPFPSVPLNLSAITCD